MSFSFQKKTRIGEFNLFLIKSPNGGLISKINDILSKLDTKIRPIPVAHLSVSRLISSNKRVKIVQILRKCVPNNNSVYRDLFNGHSLLELYNQETVNSLKFEFDKADINDYTIIPVKK